MAEAAYAPVTETLAPVVGPTPEEIERRKLMAAALLKNAMGSEPIGHWTQGVSNIVQALVAGRMEKKAGEAEAAAQAETWRNIAASDLLFGGGGGGGEYADVPGAEAVSGDDAATMRYAGEAPPAGTAAIYQGMLKRGMNPAQAAAFAASVQQESGGNPNANNPGEGARGIIQWRADRLRNLQNFASRQGKPWNNADTQMDFALWEMQNTEPGPGQMFRAAQTPEQANQALKAYIRYGDKAGPAGPAGWDSSKRLANTRRILGAMGGAAPAGETADIPGAEPVGSEPPADVAQFLGQPPAQPEASLADRQALIAKALAGPPENPADVAADVRKYYAGTPSAEPATTARPPPRPPVGETAGIPGAEPIGFAPSPDVMAHITGRQPTPAGVALPPGYTGGGDITPAPLPRPRPTAGAPYDPLTSIRPPAAPAAVAPPLAARVPQPRPAPPVAPATPTTTGAVAAPAPARPVYSPPVKNDYNAMPGRPPAALPMRPGQLMQEPYSGPMSAQEFARQGQAAMRARRAGQQPTGLAYAPTPGGQPPQPRRGLLQALLGRGGPQGQAGTPAAPVASGAPAGGTAAPMDPQRAAMARLLADPRVPDALKVAALKRMSPQERKLINVPAGGTLVDPVTRQPVYTAPAKPEKREIREDANGIPRYVDTQEPVFGGDTAGGGKPPVKITDVAAMRKEISGLDSYKRYAKAAPVFNSLADSYAKDTRAGDLDFVYAMATIFDPDSVVREGEQILVRNTANLPDQVVNGISSLMSGKGQLDKDTRRSLWDTVYGRVQQYREAAETEMAPYPDIAGRWGVDPADIMPELLELKTLPDAAPSSPVIIE